MNNLNFKEKLLDDKFKENLVREVTEDFEIRRAERLSLERQWELNMNFMLGNQYCKLDGRGEITTEDKDFFWQKREVFNHVAPLIETRLAKFARVKPIISVRPKTDDDEDAKNAVLAEKLIEGAFEKTGLYQKVKKVTAWSEICGTGFYKILWNENGGNVIGSFEGLPVKEGDVEVVGVSPFEIFPDNLHAERIEDCFSIIHAKAISIDNVYQRYGVKLVGEDIDVISLNTVKKSPRDKNKKSVSSAVVVIEKYEMPSREFPNGRLITVAGGKLLHYGELPYKNGREETRTFPFVKQESASSPASFFGRSLIERLIPIQRSYNAVKNRKHEFINRLSTGVMTVEDGSVDVDDLKDDGLSPGKVLVYRQGANPPEMMDEPPVPEELTREEERLLNEFVVISGISDVASNKDNANVSSGTALELLIEQDNERLMVSAEIIRNCYLEIAKQILHLYSQFITGVKSVKGSDGFLSTKIYYVNKKTAASDDVYLASENELMYTPAQQKSFILELFKSGLLFDEEGKIPALTKEKVFTLLGYKDLDSKKNLSRLQEDKAYKENVLIKSRAVAVDEIDDHAIHLDEHTRFILSEYENLSEEEKKRFSAHVILHKQKLKEEKSVDKNLSSES